MSWDVILLKSKIDLENPKATADPLGYKSAVISNLTTLLPNLDFSDRSWGILTDGQLSIEFNIGNDELVDTIMLHIRGGGDPLVVIKAICDNMTWAALDCSSTEFIDTNNLSKTSWEAFQQYRDKVVGLSNK